MDAEDKGGETQQTKATDFLTEKQLFDSLFELADTWCQNIDEYEYKDFFKALEFRLHYSGQQDQTAY